MPWAIRHVRHNWQFSSLGVVKILLGTKFRYCQLGRTNSIHISKVPLFRASVDPLCQFGTNMLESKINSKKCKWLFAAAWRFVTNGLIITYTAFKAHKFWKRGCCDYRVMGNTVAIPCRCGTCPWVACSPWCRRSTWKATVSVVFECRSCSQQRHIMAIESIE